MTDPKIEVLPIEQAATPDPNNINKHTARGGALVVNSLQRRGAFRSIASAGKDAQTPVVYAGNLTLEKAVEAGFTEVVNVHVTGNQLVNVVRDDVAPGSPEAIALGLEDNESGKQSYNPDIDILAALAAGDDAILSALRKEDKTFGGMLEGMGLKDEPQDAEPQIDRAAELLEKWGVVTGDLWRIGEHRLLCGDSTKRGDVERVMGGERAELAPVDPPYNIDYEYDEYDDNKTAEDYAILAQIWFTAIKRVSDKQIITPGRQNIYLWLGFDSCHIGAWIKPNAHGGASIAHFAKWEPILFYGKHIRNRDSDVFDFHVDNGFLNDNKATGQPCPKPLTLWSDLIENYSDPNAIIYESFAGSGTTLVACQNLGRKCRAIEISPAYCAVILERMATAFPGIEIVKL